MNRQQKYIVADDEAGERLDRFITDRELDISRSYARKLILEGHVTVGDSPTKPSYNLNTGDMVRVNLPVTRPQIETMPEDIPLDIVFEDADLIVVDKPAGMVVHPAVRSSSGTLANALVERVSPELYNMTPERPGIVHRLDKGTSGTIVVAKTVEAYHGLIAQFKGHDIRRKYMALVCGVPKQENDIISAAIGRSRRDRRKMAVISENSREAVTHFSIAARYEQFALLEVFPKTGRTHQIRVHLSHIGYPLAGDPKYGGRKRALNTASSQAVRIALDKLHRQALHAQVLGFVHPRTDEQLEFSTPIPEDIQGVIDVLEENIRVFHENMQRRTKLEP